MRFLGSFTLATEDTFVKMSDFDTGRMVEFKHPLYLKPGRWFLEIDDIHNRVVVSQVLIDTFVELK